MEYIEKELEKRCVLYARKQGFTAWKNEKNSNKGIPDYSFLSKKSHFFMVEFKKSKAAKIQPEQLTWINKFSGITFICYDFETFQEILTRFQDETEKTK